jgi:hypothetical protein
MKQKFILRDDQIKLRATRAIMGIPIDPMHEVIIREHNKDRSIAQNSLLWLWQTLIANELGWTKEEVHRYYKKTFLVHIFERDDEEYALMIATVRTVHKAGMKKEAKRLSDAIINLTSTTDASVKQMTEYLKDIERDATDQGIRLPHPKDRYEEAMG